MEAKMCAIAGENDGIPNWYSSGTISLGMEARLGKRKEMLVALCKSLAVIKTILLDSNHDRDMCT